MSAQAKRAVVTAVITVAICVGIALYVGLYLVNVPGSSAATQTAAGTHLYLATVATAEPSDPHNTWVSYYVVNSASNDWRHDTTFQVPANTLVHFTIYQYDTSTGLRNPFFSQPSGTVGPVLIDGKPTTVVDPSAPAHTFAIPDESWASQEVTIAAHARTDPTNRRPIVPPPRIDAAKGRSIQ